MTLVPRCAVIAQCHVPLASILIASISLAIWLYLALARGQFWRLRPFDDDLAKRTAPTEWPSVVAIVPARNEAETIAPTVAALLQQNYPGAFSIIVVDDHSEDGTSLAAQEKNTESRVKIQSASELPPGWTGKLWALQEGISAPPNTSSQNKNLSSRAERGTCFSSPQAEHTIIDAAPTFFWFTDADIVHAPDTLHRLVARAEQEKLDLASLMVLLQAKTLPERALIPAFLFFFLKLYPPRWTADAKSRTAGAAGGSVLLRRTALERFGGLAAIRSEVIDDCALARAAKRSGGKIWMGLTRASVSLRAYRTFGEIRDMIARTAFTQLGYSSLLLLGTMAGMFFTYLAPIAVLFAPNSTAHLLGLAAWLLMSLTFLPTVHFYRLSPLWAPLLPVTALFYSYATCLSAARYYLGRGAQWKGRSQAHPAP